MELQIYKKVHTWYLTDDDGTLYLIKYSKDYTMDTDNYFMVYNCNKDEYLNGEERKEIMRKLHEIEYNKDKYKYTECIGKYTIRQEGEPERE